MKRTAVAAALVLLTQGAARQSARVEVCGTLLGADGQPPLRAAVVVSRPILPGSGIIKEDERLLGKQELSRTAEFCVSAGGSGLLQLQAYGVNHKAADALLWAELGSKHRVTIRLAAPPLAADLSAAKAVCYQRIPTFTELEDAPLARQPDGRYLAVIAGKDVAATCDLYGVTRDTCVEAEPQGPDCFQATPAQTYELYRGYGLGRYTTVVTPVNGKASVWLDPALLPRSSAPAQILFPASDGMATRLTAIWQAILARELKDRSGAPRPELNERLLAAAASARAEPDRVVRHALWTDYLSRSTAHARHAASSPVEADRRAVAEALQELTPRSEFWPLIRTHLFDAVETAGLAPTPDGYAGDVIRHLSTPSERPLAIDSVATAARNRGDAVALNAWLAWLLRDYDSHYLARAARERYKIDQRVQVGKPFPAFAVASLDDSKTVLSVKTIEAKLLLVDFWATWCSPCIAEIPNLQRAYDRFSKQGFRILSYSLDSDADAVRQFRRSRFPMPWLHAIFPQGADGLTADFGLFGIPAPVLIDAQGRVVAMRDDLLGGKLEPLLATLLK